MHGTARAARTTADPGGRWWSAAGLLGLGALVLVVAATGVPVAPPAAPAATLAGDAVPAAAPVAEPVAEPGVVAGVATSRPAAAQGLARSVPVSLDVDRIGVHTALMTLGLQSDGTVEVPPLRPDAPAGWYREGPSPGEPGPAVLLGHVDSARDGPAVFYRLGELRRGDVVRIRRADGRTVRFRVTDVVLAPKDAFPTEAVYGATERPELRLVTCGGSFDRSTHTYRDNTIVFATWEA